MSEAEDASDKVSNLTAVEAISARLAEVTRLAEKLDARLCEAGARTRPVPMSSSAMSSTSSLFSLPTSTSAASSSVQPISAGISSIATANAPTIPMISSSTPAPQFQPRSVSTFSTTTAKGALASSSSTAPAASANGSCIGIERVSSPVVQTAAKAAEKSAAGTDSDRMDSSLNRGLDAGGSKQAEDVAEDIIDKSCDESVADDSNVECYVTATECSTTPTGRSRSESFVTSPECEDLAAPATMTPVCDTWWNIEDSKITTANAATSSSVIRQSELPKVPELEKTAILIEVSKPESEQNGERKVEKFVTMEKIVEDKSGKIVKEVTETTTLRVSHDTRLGVASYKVISNTVQDHRENVDVKEIKDLESIVTPETYEKTNGHHHETELGSKSESYSRRDELSTKSDDGERTIKCIKVSGKTEESKPFVTPVDTTKEMTLSLKEYTRHHEDSGIEMSPTKREDSLEGQDFLEKARKVSPIDGPSINGKSCCSCNCSHEAACFDRYSVQQSFIELSSVNENRRRLPLSNAS